MKKPEVPKLGDARSSYIIVGGVRGGGVLAVRSGLFLSLGEGRGGGGGSGFGSFVVGGGGGSGSGGARYVMVWISVCVKVLLRTGLTRALQSC